MEERRRLSHADEAETEAEACGRVGGSGVQWRQRRRRGGWSCGGEASMFEEEERESNLIRAQKIEEQGLKRMDSQNSGRE